jgi:hypothetical protein
LLLFQDPINPYPILKVDSTKPEIILCVEGCQITNIANFTVGMAALIAAHWTFNLKFNRKVAKTMNFYSVFILKEETVHPMQAVGNLVNKLLKKL